MTISVCNLMAAGMPASDNLLSASRQMILVTTADWDTSVGKMQCFERQGTDAEWSKLGDTIPIVVGRTGLGLGRGLAETGETSGPRKMEGDGKAPAGIFRLGPAFGLAEPASMQWLRMPYQQLTSTVECVDDTSSTHYNCITDRASVTNPDWNSSEKMQKVGEQYRLGIVVQHNTDRKPEAGSCIFIHIWENDHTGTGGCTAMAPDQMEKLMHWVDASHNPVLVQFPRTQYDALKNGWHLPTLKP